MLADRLGKRRLLATTVLVYSCGSLVCGQLVAPVVVGYAVAAHGLAGVLTIPLVLALETASWVWVLPETRSIALGGLPAMRDRS